MKRTLGAMRTRLCAVAIAVAVALAAHGARAEQVKLTWFMWSGSEPEVTAWKHVADLVTQKYPDISVEFQTTSFPDYWTKLPALAASRQAARHREPAKPAGAGLRQADGAARRPHQGRQFRCRRFDQSIMKGLSRDGKQFALPYDFGPLVLYYNHDMFAKAGVPLPKPGWTEADFMTGGPRRSRRTAISDLR